MLSERVRRGAQRRIQRAKGVLREALRTPPEEPLAKMLFLYARAHPRAFVVQIGAHDSSQLDPLRPYILKHGWSGILVEPMPEVFQRLKQNYAEVDGLLFENVAIAPEDGSMDIHYVPQTTDEGLPPWYDALASFRRDVLLKHKEFIPDIEDRIETASVPCLTFDSLCAKNEVTTIDVIQIDTEGFDFEIIKLIDLDRFRPALLQFEELHMDDATRRECIRHLESFGYEALGNSMDCLCVHPERLRRRRSSLRRAWRRMRADRSNPLYRT